MRAIVGVLCGMTALLAIGVGHAELPKATIHVATGPRSDVIARPGDLIQLEHTFSLRETPKDAFAITNQPKSVAFVRTYRLANAKVTEGATIVGLFKAESRGKAIINLEIVEANGKRTVAVCTVDVR